MSGFTTPSTYPDDQLEGVVTLLELIRSERAGTRQQLAHLSGLGRTAVTNRVNELMDRGLVAESGLGPPIGGRQPRQLRFRAGAGIVLVADIGATSISVGCADLSGRPLVKYEEPWKVALGGAATLERVEQPFDQMLTSPAVQGLALWGIGIGVPGPVEFATGRPISPPIMPGWDGYPVRQQISQRFKSPVWVDNDANVMALGELRARSGCGRIATVVDPRLHGSVPGLPVGESARQIEIGAGAAQSTRAQRLRRLSRCSGASGPRYISRESVGLRSRVVNTMPCPWGIVSVAARDWRVITGARLQPVDVESHQLGRTQVNRIRRYPHPAQTRCAR